MEVRKSRQFSTAAKHVCQYLNKEILQLEPQTQQSGTPMIIQYQFLDVVHIALIIIGVHPNDRNSPAYKQLLQECTRFTVDISSRLWATSRWCRLGVEHDLRQMMVNFIKECDNQNGMEKYMRCGTLKECEEQK